MEGSQVVVEELAGNITDLRVGVTQWASGNPRVELGITTNIAAAIDVLDPNKIFSRDSQTLVRGFRLHSPFAARSSRQSPAMKRQRCPCFLYASLSLTGRP